MGASLSPERKDQLLAWAADFDYACFLDNCGTGTDRYGQYEFILAVADRDSEVCHSWEELTRQLEGDDGAWWFGSLTYELKNELEPKLKTTGPAPVPFPSLCFFRADTIIFQRKGSDELESYPPYAAFLSQDKLLPPDPQVEILEPLRSNFTQEAYEATVEQLRQHIFEGDCYEVNLSQHFRGRAQIASPAVLWRRLTQVSPTPFAAYLRCLDTHLLCASPERFLQLKGDRLITQPIKGTAPRSADPNEDQQLAQSLRASTKEQAENVMIVDLSRHDLYQSTVVNGVRVPHLFEVQSFAKVHHLVSTIEGKKRPEVKPWEALGRMFPPGSMTGAPKFRTCELIDKAEPDARGMYAGSVGYFAPGGDFDFNVVIRSMVYNAELQVLSYHSGGAITWDSNARAEYEETLVKLRAIQEALGLFSFPQ